MDMNRWINLVASITLIEMMLAIGLGAKLEQILKAAGDWKLVVRAAFANYLLVPAAGTGLLLLFNASPMVATGILIAAVCPGAPYGPPLTLLAKGNAIVAVGLMVILAASSAVLAPLLLRLLLPIVTGDHNLQFNVFKMVSTLGVSQFLPLCAGLVVSQIRPRLAERLNRPASRLCGLLNLVLLGMILAVQFPMLVQIRLVGYFGMLVLVTLALLAGWLLAAPGASNRKTLALTTAVRNVGVALVIASSSFPGTPAVTATTAYALFQTVVIALVALVWGRLSSSEDALRAPQKPISAM